MSGSFLDNIYIFFLFICIKNTQAKKKTLKKLTKQSNFSILQIPNEFLIGVLVVSLLYAIYFLYSRKQAQLRALKLISIKQAIQKYQLSKKDKASTLTQLQKQQAILWFKNQVWVLQQIDRKQKPFSCQLKLCSILRKNQPLDQNKFYKDYYDAYYVSFKGHDKYGSFDIFGVIMFQKYFMTLFLQKSHKNIKNSKGQYQFKFFDGVQKKGNFQGKWFNSNQSQFKVELKSSIQHCQQEAKSERSFSKSDGDKSSSISIKYAGRFKLFSK